ncbi:hypothetical protein [Hydromonas duriensis]|uniref:Uncharacterized protein n=1 Tax=Hydromonas duriensis TaxID=1527608 RepID=A0A4R6YBR0_9BURK|nr:hypothetical protein [Hydromonas duriensis]TDR33034.1 hypothetical protein DFR44_10184 [Hydromonas duriensis]
MKYFIFSFLLLLNILLGLYSTKQLDGVLPEPYQRTTYLNAGAAAKQVEEALVDKPAPVEPAGADATHSSSEPPTVVEQPSAPVSSFNDLNAQPNAMMVSSTPNQDAPSESQSQATSLVARSKPKSIGSSAQFKAEAKSNRTVTPVPVPVPSVTTFVHTAPAPIVRAPEPVSVPTESNSAARHAPNKNIAGLCQNSTGAWLPCR